MIRLLTLAMIVLTAFAVNVQAAACEPDEDPEACQANYCDAPDEAVCKHGDEATSPECDGEVCAYGNETCIECSGPVGETPTRGPEDGSCENCRTLTDAEVKKDANGYNLLAGLAAVAAAMLMFRRK